MKIEIEKIIIRVKIIDQKKLKAIISLDFGELIVKGFRVLESEYENPKGDKLWITPPSYLGMGKYHPIFYMPDKNLWKSLEMKLWGEYYKQKNEYYKKQYDLDKNIELIT